MFITNKFSTNFTINKFKFFFKVIIRNRGVV